MNDERFEPLTIYDSRSTIHDSRFRRHGRPGYKPATPKETPASLPGRRESRSRKFQITPPVCFLLSSGDTLRRDSSPGKCAERCKDGVAESFRILFIFLHLPLESTRNLELLVMGACITITLPLVPEANCFSGFPCGIELILAMKFG